MLYDTHCHPYLASSSPQDVIERFFAGGGAYLNSIGVDIASSQVSIDLAQKYSGVFASIGIHPCDVLQYKDNTQQVINELEDLYNRNISDVVAIGEAGLDYHWLESMSEKSGLDNSELISLQKTFLNTQIDLAKKLKLPLIIHNRNAAQDIFELLQKKDFKNFIFHCYSEDLGFAQKLINFAPNCKLGFGGITTFKSATDIQNTLAHIPLKNIIIETDSPYLTPTPYRGKRENEPILVEYVLSKIIDLRKESSEVVSEQIYKNSIEIFGVNI